MNKSEQANEALDRAESGSSLSNYPAIYAGFMAKGISESDIHPRENVFTFAAWIAKGRVVKRGEHGVKVVSWIPITDKESGEITGKRPKSATVFHETQTGAKPEPKTDSDRAAYRAPEHAPDHPAFTTKPETTDRWVQS
jgi:hypothetical protein